MYHALITLAWQWFHPKYDYSTPKSMDLGIYIDLLPFDSVIDDEGLLLKQEIFADRGQTFDVLTSL